MASDWQLQTLSALLAVPTRNGIHKGQAFQGRGVPVVKMGEVYHADIIRDQPRDLLDLTPDELTRLEVRTGDLLLCRTSLVADGVGHCALVGDLSQRSTFASNLIRVRMSPERADPRFWFYYFRSSLGKHQLLSLARGTAVTTITGPDIAALNVVAPEVGEQRAIAQILGTLDDKIELNRRMNETLQAIARALFKSWFVDFSPVRAKSEGHDPGLVQPLADLFPDSFRDSELGEIPKGWRVVPIGELATVVGGSTPSTREASFWENGRNYWATPKDLSALATPVVLETGRRITDTGLAQIGSGLLPPGTILLSSRAPIGYLAIAEVPLAINQGFIAMRPTVGVSNLFLLYWAEWASEVIVSRANGSTFLEISKSNFRPIPVVAPPQEIFESFDHVARPAHLRIVANERETRNLTSLRDTLLPRLISGDLRVPQAEKMLAGAGAQA
jgi:type I restriction enzyme, S subunit